MVSMVGTLIPRLMTVIGLFSKMGLATRLEAAGQWVLNAALTANPLGIAIVAIAGLMVVLYALEKKFGIVTKAWQAFSSNSIGMGIFAFIEDGKKGSSLFGVGVTGDANPPGCQPSHLD
jgi:predicted amino acid dehydrogenase